MVDTLSDLLTRIRNALSSGHKSVIVKSSKVSKAVLTVLKEEGYIEGFAAKKSDEGFEVVDVHLKYMEKGRPMISSIRRISVPGRRVYRGVDDIRKVQSGIGISILSTSSGVMADYKAREKKVGGEVLAVIE